MFELKISYPTIEELQSAVAKLNSDGSQLNLPLAAEAKAPTKAAAKKAATATATVEELPAPKKPAGVKGKTKYTLDQLKAHVATLVDPSEGEKIKGFAKSYGVAKYSDLSEAQIQQAYADAETYFASAEGEAEEAEADPMD